MLRAGALLGVLACLGWSVAPARAQQGTMQVKAAIITRFAGQVIVLNGLPEDPTGFTLQVEDGRLIDFLIAPTAKFTPRSAQAQVERLQQGDYALIYARRISQNWVANRIVFDVAPFPGINRFTLTGAIVRVSKDNKRFALQLDTGDIHWITITRQTKFRDVNSQLMPSPPLLVKQTTVQVLVHRTGNIWLALEIDLKSSAGSPV
jgi:hypothetical protein